MKISKENRLNIIFSVITIVCILGTLAFILADVTMGDESEAATVIKQGSTGSTVRTIQTKLKRWGYYTGSVDGIFGSQTTAAVKYFQRKNGLTADGIVGRATAKAMGITLTSGGGSAGSNSNDEYLLARLIYGEARGEPYTGQVAVGAVVMNRVRSASFPNTIAGVIYQSGAFTAVDDGQINLTPNETAFRAARDAMNGWDPTYGCIFYYNPRTATSAWIRQKEIRLTIGQHVFCV